MESFLDMVCSSIVVQGVLSIVLGALLAFVPQITTITVINLLALYLAITGIVSLVTYFRSKNQKNSPSVLVAGVLFLLIALIVFLSPQAVAGILSLLLGVLLTVSGVVDIMRSLELRKRRGSAWAATLVVSIVVAIGGIIIIINPFETAMVFVAVLGVLLMVKGIIDLAIEASLSRLAKQF